MPRSRILDNPTHAHQHVYRSQIFEDSLGNSINFCMKVNRAWNVILSETTLEIEPQAAEWLKLDVATGISENTHLGHHVDGLV